MYLFVGRVAVQRKSGATVDGRPPWADASRRTCRIADASVRPCSMTKPPSASSEDSGDARRVMDALRRLVRALRLSSSEVERRLGISGAQLYVLVELEAAPRCSIGDIAKRTQTDPSSVSTVVARLVEQGLVARTADPIDARRAILGVTAKGRALVRKAGPPAQTRIVDALATMTPERRRSLAGSLDVLVTALGADAGEPSMFFEDERTRKPR